MFHFKKFPLRSGHELEKVSAFNPSERKKVFSKDTPTTFVSRIRSGNFNPENFYFLASEFNLKFFEKLFFH